ncbi:hypothetical protein GN244_ATG01741 [Phytophthora infestans]|uniref:Uncharacterized protein n=1 Tax=Phytophthora infestans TaxID=4787 RepID=A0A833TDT2_PHYIN|nr:hypothetical protein GN244_ATG01741 [Phytophthora infestans]
MVYMYRATWEVGEHRLCRLLNDEKPPAPLGMAVPEDDVVTKSGENHAWLHRGDGGCYRGSQRWPRCKSYRHLEQDQPDDANEILAKEDGERNAPWHRRRGGCFPGSRLWPRCRGWGGRGNCFSGSILWPSCRRTR